ncbi:MAG TPA: hypothetical protein VN040_03370 [Pseudosphingobacterium sp.]|nr:hypothetical protein [Pseudosphingobacterium sp.]
MKNQAVEWFPVGSYKAFTANASAKLDLRVNDGDPENNSGIYIVRYGINKIVAA